MAVSIDHSRESGGLGLQIELGDIVQHVNGKAAEFDDFRLRQLARPGACVDVPADGRNRRNLLQLLKNFGITHISGVNNVLGFAQCRYCLRTKQPVRVGNDAY